MFNIENAVPQYKNNIMWDFFIENAMGLPSKNMNKCISKPFGRLRSTELEGYGTRSRKVEWFGDGG
jgi:hypothetical protein